MTVDNWRSVDPTSALLVELDPTTGYPRPITPDRWALYFLEPQLDSNVPAQVRTMFNVARGVMLYGSFFYPLYTLGAEQLYRVADAATWHRCRQLGKPVPAGRPERETFAERVGWLRRQGALIDAQWWGDTQASPHGGVRMLRNLASHSTFQQLDMPGTAVTELRRATEKINELFASAAQKGER